MPNGSSRTASIAGMEPPQMDLEEYEEVWTGDYIFENEWQTFRTKKDRSAGTDQRCARNARRAGGRSRSRWWTSSATTR